MQYAEDRFGFGVLPPPVSLHSQRPKKQSRVGRYTFPKRNSMSSISEGEELGLGQGEFSVLGIINEDMEEGLDEDILDDEGVHCDYEGKREDGDEEYDEDEDGGSGFDGLSIMGTAYDHSSRMVNISQYSGLGETQSIS